MLRAFGGVFLFYMDIKIPFIIETFCYYCGKEVMLLAPNGIKSEFVQCSGCGKKGLVVLEELIDQGDQNED